MSSPPDSPPDSPSDSPPDTQPDSPQDPPPNSPPDSSPDLPPDASDPSSDVSELPSQAPSSSKIPSGSLADAASRDRPNAPDRLARAQRRLRVERRILSDERAAFQAFGDRLLALDAPVRTATIESHYRDTVMAVPHYADEYGDTLPQSLAAELGSAVAFDCTCNRTLERSAVEAIREAAERCWRARDDLVDRIDAESHAVETAAEALADLRCSLDALDDAVAGDAAVRLRLAVLRERCDALARRRRADLHPDESTANVGDGCGSGADGRPSAGGGGSADGSHAADRQSDGEHPPAADHERLHAGDLQSLCYCDLDDDRPVLAAIDELRRAVDRRRRAVLDRRSGDC